MSEPTRRPQLPPAHEPLHEDVSYLGNLLGQVLREQQGQELFDRVETVRHASIRRRTEGTPLDSLAELVAGLPLESANPLVQAFSVYFSLTNLAEQVHRIRRRRDYQLAGTLQPGSLDAVFDALAGADPQAVATALRDLCIFPVLTAHPTEATRRTILKKEQRIARALVDRLEQTRRTPHEDQRITQRIRSEIGLIWQTAPQATMRPSVADEVEHVLFFLTEVVYRIVAPFHEAMEEASARLPGVVYTASRPLLCFGSWVGGDMDGNPNAGAETLTAALGRQRQMILGRYRAQVRGLFEYLSHSGERASFNPDVPARVAAYRELFPNAAIPERYGDMPYRVLLWQIWHRLGLTESDAPGGYSHAAEMIHDLEVIERSLLENRGARAGRVQVRRLLLQVRTFGFHLATLDVRQDGRVHQDVVEELLGIAGYAAMPQSERTRHLEAALSRAPEAPGRPPPA